MGAKDQVAVPDTTAAGPSITENALGGGIEGARRNTAEMFTWRPAIISPDTQINPHKDLADARGRDAIQNDGLLTGAVHSHRDSVVGTQFRLSCTPDWEALGATEEWADQFQRVVEARFNSMADSVECWFDASRQMTFTEMIRLDVGVYLYTGETLATVEWLDRDRTRPFKTAIQMLSPTRLSNPDMGMDTDKIRAGIERDQYGQPIAYHIRQAFPGDVFNFTQLPQWKRVPARKPWGRRQVLHIKETLQPDQTRGVADMVSALKKVKMTKKFSDITLQNAVVNATYAAAVESELPTEAIFQAMGAGGPGFSTMLGEYMGALAQYIGSTDNIAIDGVKMPHLFPGTKLSLKNAGTPGGVGTSFEESLLRHIAAPLGLSYEQFSRDYTKTNYSSARASMAETHKFMQGRKKYVADRKATMVYVLWLEEEINRPDSVIPLPPNFDFYDPYMREALVSCEWIGASRGQIDEVKETQASVMRVGAGLSTRQKEIALQGEDYRKVFRQLAREQRMMKELGLEFGTDATKPGTNDRQQTMNDKEEKEDE